MAWDHRLAASAGNGSIGWPGEQLYKAERTPVPGAGFSPEAVPGNEVEGDDTRNRQQRHSGLKSNDERLTPKS
jgi:hypothetical protein